MGAIYNKETHVFNAKCESCRRIFKEGLSFAHCKRLDFRHWTSYGSLKLFCSAKCQENYKIVNNIKKIKRNFR